MNEHCTLLLAVYSTFSSIVEKAVKSELSLSTIYPITAGSILVTRSVMITNKMYRTVLYSVLPDAEVKLCETDSKNTVPFQNVV